MDPVSHDSHRRSRDVQTNLHSSESGALSLHGEVNVSTESELLTFENVGEQFAEHIAPLLSDCKQFNLESGEKGAFSALQVALKNPELRAIAWAHLMANGLEGDLSEGQRHALIAGLLPYLGEEQNSGFLAVVKVLDSVVSARDYQLYRYLGEHLLTVPPPVPINWLLVKSFLALSTHNAQKETHFKPWIELFVRHGDSILYSSIMDEVMGRVRNRELSSYDHLLDVVCSPQSLKTANALSHVTNPPTLCQSEVADVQVRHSIDIVVSTFCGNAVLGFPLAVGFSYLLRGLGEGFLLNVVVSSLLSAAMLTRRDLKASASVAKETIQQQHSFFNGDAFMNLAERTYGKLWRLRDASSEVRQVLQEMEAQPLFDGRIGAWREATASN